jgi:hypothetical protein
MPAKARASGIAGLVGFISAGAESFSIPTIGSSSTMPTSKPLNQQRIKV